MAEVGLISMLRGSGKQKDCSGDGQKEILKSRPFQGNVVQNLVLILYSGLLCLFLD